MGGGVSNGVLRSISMEPAGMSLVALSDRCGPESSLGECPLEWSGMLCGVGFCGEITCVLSQKEASDLVTGGVFASLELAQVRVVLSGMGANQYPIW